jgi:hypothetical protein
MVRAMFAKSILALAAMATTPASQPGKDSLPEQERFLLTCIGTMRAAGAPLMPIMASGVVDLAGKRVAGFGVGNVPILLLTDALIGFGGTVADGEHIEGSLDRQNGKARIVVLTAKEPAQELMAMELDCRPTLSIS